MSEVGLLFGIRFVFLFVFGCLVKVMFGGLKIDSRWISRPLSEFLHEGRFIFGIGSDLREFKEGPWGAVGYLFVSFVGLLKGFILLHEIEWAILNNVKVWNYTVSNIIKL